MYGRRSPEDVHAIMTKYDVSYVILEDSICLSASRNNCRIPDLIDINNGVVSLLLFSSSFININCLQKGITNETFHQPNTPCKLEDEKYIF